MDSGTLTLNAASEVYNNLGTLSSGVTSILGGGIYLYADETDASSAHLVGGNIHNNEADFGGGVFTAWDATLTGATLTDNLASDSGGGDDGGGLYLYIADVNMDGGSATANTGDLSGGGAWLDLSTLTVTVSDWGGGGTANVAEDVTIAGGTGDTGYGTGASFICDTDCR